MQKKDLESTKKSKRIWNWGNYHGYYGYRPLSTRLKLLEHLWLFDKNILDVGCNSGIFTIAIALYFQAKHILGIDIDKTLISYSLKNLRRSQNAIRLGASHTSFVGGGNCNWSELNKFDSQFPISKIISFLHCDILNYNPQCQHDTVLCLSVTKWIHLNNGDDGILRLFKNFYQVLVSGGYLILEIQSWSSYRKYRKITPQCHANYKSIKIFPDQFPSTLTQMGFHLINVVSPTTSHTQGFSRPIYAFQK